MNRSDLNWGGYYAALPTPFTANGALDLTALGAVAEQYISQGVHGLLVNGSTGEWATQNFEERCEVAATAVASVAGRVPVIVAATHVELTASMALARHAEEIGADSVMIPPPPGVRPTQRELYSYYEQVTASTTLPCWLYNFPQENNHNLTLEQIGELIQIPNVVAIKQSARDDRELFATIEAYGDQVFVFGNLLSRLGLAAMTGGFGGDGHFGSGMPLGERMPRFFEHVWRGEIEEAAAIADQFAALMERVRGGNTDGYNWRYGGMQASLKALMNILGQPGGYPRAPKLPITDPEAIEEIAAALRDAGLEVMAR